MVKRDPKTTANLLNQLHGENGNMMERVSAVYCRARLRLAEGLLLGDMDPEREKTVKKIDPKKMRGPDLCYRDINRLPYCRPVYPIVPGMTFSCNVCEKEIEIDARGEAKKEINGHRLEDSILLYRNSTGKNVITIATLHSSRR